MEYTQGYQPCFRGGKKESGVEISKGLLQRKRAMSSSSLDGTITSHAHLNISRFPPTPSSANTYYTTECHKLLPYTTASKQKRGRLNLQRSGRSHKLAYKLAQSHRAHKLSRAHPEKLLPASSILTMMLRWAAELLRGQFTFPIDCPSHLRPRGGMSPEGIHTP